MSFRQKLRFDRQIAIVARTWLGADTICNFLLDEEYPALQRSRISQIPADHCRCGIVREISGDYSCPECAEIRLQRILSKYGKTFFAFPPGLKMPDQEVVDFQRDDLIRVSEQMFGKRSASGSDFDRQAGVLAARGDRNFFKNSAAF